jgi:release factor glutamine methyltransferase
VTQPEPETLSSAINDAAAALVGGGFDEPRRRARRLVGAALRLSPSEVFAHPERPLAAGEAGQIEAMLARMLAHEPISRIFGVREFWGLELQLSPDTLDPRPETESVVEAVLARLPDRTRPYRLLDLGTGSGCLLLTLLSEFPSAFGIGLDIAQDAAALATANAKRLGLAGRSAFAVGDWTNPIGTSFDLIVSNPPYIKCSDIESLMPEVANHEPRIALDGGDDGYDAYRVLVPNLRQHLEPNGAAVLELGQGQAIYVSECAREAGLRTTLRLDLAAIPRAIVLTTRDREKIVWQS